MVTFTDRCPRHVPPARVLCAAAIALACLAAPALADVYKWVDAQGGVHYSDRPPPADAKTVTVEQTPVLTHHSDRPPAPPAAPAAAAAPAAKKADNPAAKQAVAADVAAAAADSCKQAQQRYQNDIRSRKMFREDANQQRTYLTGDEIQAERVAAKQEMDEACAAANGNQ